MKTLVKIVVRYNHRLENYELEVIKSTNVILDHKQYYELHWITSPYNNLLIDLIWKKDLNKIKQDFGTWNYVLITTNKKYNNNKEKIKQKMMDVAINKLVNCFKQTFIELNSFI